MNDDRERLEVAEAKLEQIRDLFAPSDDPQAPGYCQDDDCTHDLCYVRRAVLAIVRGES